MHDPQSADQCGRPHHDSRREALIRTLSVSLVAVAAIAASLLLTRNRAEDEGLRRVHAGDSQAPRQELDAIRAAGL
jgi:hypothetical protein